MQPSRAVTVSLAAACTILAAACSRDAAITAPSAAAVSAPVVISLEGELGSGQGEIRERSRASAGRTVHLAPGEERIWAIPISAAPAAYAISVIYANGQEGLNETLTVGADSVVLGLAAQSR